MPSSSPAKQTIDEEARFLLNAFPEAGSFYEEEESLVHTISHGVIEVATNFADYSTYFVTLADGKAVVRKEQLDNYKLHERATVVQGKMDDEDYEELAKSLASVAAGVRAERALKTDPGADTKEQLINLLFANPALGPRPAQIALPQQSSYALSIALQDMLDNAGRQASFEWKEWAAIGVSEINRLPALQALGIALARPAPAVQQTVMSSRDFSQGALAWFREQLAPHGLTLLAIDPIDELQAFTIVDLASAQELTALLKKLHIKSI